MPITRIPVVHKFGIISQSQRVGLEERIAKKALSETRSKVLSQRTVPRPLPFEVTEDFVYKFNDSCQEERRKLEDTAMKMLKRLKRLAGLREAGEVIHADLPRAWVDLALLAQCRNQKLEDGCLETLVASLDQALVSEEHVLSLFYLAKSGIHWLKRDSKNEAVLRTGEIKLLKMTHLVFLRLYCHHLLGQLKEYSDQQTSLAQYLKGFSEKEQLYDEFPGAHLSVRFIIESGYVICTSTKSGDFTQSKLQPETKKEPSSQEPSTEANFRTNNVAECSQECNTNKDALPEDKGYSTVKSNVNGSYHFGDMTFFWHSLNVWHVVINDDDDVRVRDSLYGLFQNASHLAHESWLDIVFAFYILSDASHHHVRVLKAFQYLMSLEFSTLSVPVDPVTLCETCYSSFSNTHCSEKKTCDSVLFHKDSSSKNSGLESEKTNTSPNVLQKLQAFVGSDLTEHERITPDSNYEGNVACIGSNKHSYTRSCKWENERAGESVKDGVMQNTDSMKQSKNESQGVNNSQITRDVGVSPNTEQAKDAGVSRDLEMKDKKKTDQDFSRVAQSVRTRVGDHQQRHNWPWELVYTFCECMTKICLHGTSSNIQKISLMGDGTVTKGFDRGMKRSYGLIDFLQYDQSKDGWRVRYAAVQGLVRICHHYYGATKEGLTNAAWSALMHCQSTEKDPRVLDAIKVAKFEAEFQNKLAKDHIPVSLWSSRLASALTKILHSHVNPVHVPEPSPRISNECCSTKTSRERPVKTESDSCAKPSLRQEIALSNAWRVPQLSYTTRRNLELRAVIEVQWKKQLLEEMEKEIETNVGELEKKRDKELKIE